MFLYCLMDYLPNVNRNQYDVSKSQKRLKGVYGKCHPELDYSWLT